MPERAERIGKKVFLGLKDESEISKMAMTQTERMENLSSLGCSSSGSSSSSSRGVGSGRALQLASIRLGGKLSSEHQWLSSRWEPESEFLQRKEREQEGGRKEEGYGAWGIGVEVPVCRTVSRMKEWKARMKSKLPDMVKELQESYKLDANLEALILIDVEKCRKVLHTSGLKSLGSTAAEGLTQLVATLLVLLSLELAQKDDEQDDKEAVGYLKKLLNKSETYPGLPPDIISRLEATLRWCQAIIGQHPLACSSLELASDWPTFCGKLFGVV
ncbi:hypothetical protein ACOMHN_029777 [Nucella lapillus]